MQHFHKHRDKLERIKLLLLDVDGVMTDGTIVYDDDNKEIKRFHVRDGLGIRLLMNAGIMVGVVTGRRSKALIHRCRNLGVELIYDGVGDKAAILDTILAHTAVKADEIAFAGDDLVDIPLMKRVGLSVAVADAHTVVVEHADVTTEAPGGNGAVREICEAILKTRGHWEDVLKRYL